MFNDVYLDTGKLWRHLWQSESTKWVGDTRQDVSHAVEPPCSDLGYLDEGSPSSLGE